MAIALFAVSALFAPLQAFFAPPEARRPRSSPGARAPHAASRQAAAPCAAARDVAPQIQVQPQRAQRPLRVLRVLRVVEAHSPGAGRMVISGRMADVCAELDRLAALEASAH